MLVPARFVWVFYGPVGDSCPGISGPCFPYQTIVKGGIVLVSKKSLMSSFGPYMLTSRHIAAWGNANQGTAVDLFLERVKL